MGYQAFDPACEVSGLALVAYFECLRAQNIQPTLNQYDLGQVDAHEWYPHQLFLDIMTGISEHQDALFDLVSVGSKIVDFLHFPAEIKGIANALSTLPDSYHNFHRNGDCGEVYTEIVGDREAVVSFTVPQADEANFGLVFGTAQRFAQKGDNPVANVRVSDGFIGGMRYPTRGAAPVMIDITW